MLASSIHVVVTNVAW